MIQKIKNNLAALLSLTGHGAAFPPAEETFVERLYWAWYNWRVHHMRPPAPDEQAEIEQKLLDGPNK